MADKNTQQLQAEVEWLGIVLKDPSLWEERKVTSDHFKNILPKAFYGLLERLKAEGKTFDYNTFSKLSDDDLERIGGFPFITMCEESFLTTATFQTLEKQMQTHHIAETMQQEVKKLGAADYYKLEEVREIAQTIQETVDGIQTGKKSMRNKLEEMLEKALHMEKYELSGAPTGYDNLDRATDGWQQGEFIVIGARPSMGKTAVTVNFMIRSAEKDTIVTYIPAETGDTNLIGRTIAVLEGLPTAAMRNPKRFLNDKQFKRYVNAFGYIEDLNIHIEQQNDTREIRQLIRERKRAFPDHKHLIIVDHLGHLHNGTDYRGNNNTAVTDYCKELKDMARDFDVTVMALSQLSRGVETRQDKRPLMSDLRDSGGIEQIADMVMFLYREGYQNRDKENPIDPSEPQEMEILIAKNREGAVGTLLFEFTPLTNQLKQAF